MIELEGRMLAGLDEFMLRLGHLKVLCAAAADVGGSWFRVRREAAKILTRPVLVPADAFSLVANYLRRKRLCSFKQGDDKAETPGESGKYRYPNLVVQSDEEGLHLISSVGEPEIWWQDFCLASPG